MEHDADPRRPKIKSHYRAHKLALWLNFIPELHAAGHEDALEGRIRHHLLPHFNDPLSYAGQVSP
jgi:neuroligin